MLDVLLEAQGGRTARTARWPLPLAAGIHLALVVGAIAASGLVVERMPDPEIRIGPPILEVRLPPPSPPARLGPGGAPAAPRPRTAPPRAEAPRGSVQPRSVPDAPVPASASFPERPAVPGGGEGAAGAGGGSPDGAPWGVEGGIGPGSPDGVPGGLYAPEPEVPATPVPWNPGMDEPVLTFRVEPEYPAIARIARVQGRVILQAVITEDGGVEEVSVLSASNPLLAGPAADAVRRWKYRPAAQSGRPVKVYFTVVVEFRLE